MYPDFQYLVESLFHVDAPGWLSIFKTFGLFVAIAFLVAAYFLMSDLRRKAALGLFIPEYTTVTVGKAITSSELITSALLGFLLGFKAGGIAQNWKEVAPNPMAYLFSLQGSFLIGILAALLFAGFKYWEKRKEQLPEPKEKRIATYPHDRISELVLLAFVGGLAGAKIFNAFETWSDFIKHPIENLVSSSGLTFYGGLITAGAIIIWYARKHKIPVGHLVDSFGPALMLAYGLGRLGCHFSGDGDWGIFNSAYVSEMNGTLKHATEADFIPSLHRDLNYLSELARQFGSIENIPHLYAPAPGWLPDWIFGMNYAHNVNHEGIMIANCTGEYCTMLPVSVFPTAVYEAITCIILFGLLWFLRKKMKHSFHLFGIYLIMNGAERFLVEKIRVNYKYDWGFVHPSQAEIISVVLAVGGLCLLLFYRDKKKVSN